MSKVEFTQSLNIAVQRETRSLFCCGFKIAYQHFLWTHPLTQFRTFSSDLLAHKEAYNYHFDQIVPSKGAEIILSAMLA